MSETEDGMENTLEEDEEPQSTAGDTFLPNTTTVNSSSKRTRKHKKPDEVELKLLKALEPCSKLSFLQSLMPHLNHYTDGEFLQFQMGVLNVIENINKRKEATPQPQTMYSSLVPPYHSASSYMSQSPPAFQHQPFLPAQQPPYPLQQYPQQIPNTFDQHHTPPLRYLPQQQPQNPVNHTHSSLENLASPTPSGESTLSDQIDFGAP